jgi:hypothetical protein
VRRPTDVESAVYALWASGARQTAQQAYSPGPAEIAHAVGLETLAIAITALGLDVRRKRGGGGDLRCHRLVDGDAECLGVGLRSGGTQPTAPPVTAMFPL